MGFMSLLGFPRILEIRRCPGRKRGVREPEIGDMSLEFMPVRCTQTGDSTHALALPVSSHAHLARETPPRFMLILYETTLPVDY